MTLVSYTLDDGVATVTMDDGKVNALEAGSSGAADVVVEPAQVLPTAGSQ